MPKPQHKERPDGMTDIGGFLNSRQGKAIQREVVRGIFGMLRQRL